MAISIKIKASISIEPTWTQFKTILEPPKRAKGQFEEDDSRYFIFTFDANILYYLELYKSGFEPTGIDIGQNTTDRTDFENNYMSNFNEQIT